MDLTREQEKKLGEYMTIKKHIKACFNMVKFIEIMKESIDASPDFEFSNPYNKKFINPKKPIFILKTSFLTKETMKNMSPEAHDKLVTLVTKKLAEQVTNDIELKMMECLCDEKTYHELCEIDKELVNLCISNVYKVRVDNSKGIVTLEYFDF